MIQVAAIIIAYLLGSIPTALLVSKRLGGVDIRTLGDGNMGAHNVARQFGFKAGLIVTLVDMLKGTFALLIARWLGLSYGWQMAIGVVAVLGHDFPVFAGFRGGQGSATTMGVFLVLFPVPTVIAMFFLLMLYLITRRYNIAAPAAGGLLFVIAILMRPPWHMIVYMLALYLFIPLKGLMDRGRVRQIAVLQDRTLPEKK